MPYALGLRGLLLRARNRIRSTNRLLQLKSWNSNALVAVNCVERSQNRCRRTLWTLLTRLADLASDLPDGVSLLSTITEIRAMSCIASRPVTHSAWMEVGKGKRFGVQTVTRLWDSGARNYPESALKRIKAMCLLLWSSRYPRTPYHGRFG